VHNVIGSAVARSDPKQEQKTREDQLRVLSTPMTVEDVVERIDIAFKDGDYYRCAVRAVLLCCCCTCCLLVFAVMPLLECLAQHAQHLP
jgi:hypothetical protein